MLRAVPIEAVVVFGALALLVGVVVVALVLIVTSTRSIALNMQRVHMQQANIIRMMLKAGFRPAKSLDWFDDGAATRVAGEVSDTRFDWRRPQ